MSWVAVGVAGVGAAVSVVGSMQASSAAGRAARAMRKGAEDERRVIMGYGEGYASRLKDLAKASPAELNSVQLSIESAQKQVSSDMKLMEAIDPSILEASHQALAILRGDQAAINAPAQQQRMQQRQALVNSLRAQYGPNAETSSLGQKALQQFDSQSNLLMSQTQQSSLSQLFGIGSTRINGAGQGNLFGALNAQNTLTGRALNAEQAGGAAVLGALSGTSQSILQASGADQVGASLRAQTMQNFGNQGMNLGMMFAGKNWNNQRATPSADGGMVTDLSQANQVPSQQANPNSGLLNFDPNRMNA